ncbi:hypothetical protein [Amycolatopsis sp. CA-128772]|uniref:hypothetical protein n=1 Tax=Amycolatopsis sp. CA-128772 TaxID=2073159 RepID=UPI000CD30C39|nr:hypothetical protein [Amycolatopsis sp. CA-128772]
MTAVEERPRTRPRPDVGPGQLFAGGRWTGTDDLRLVTRCEFGQIRQAGDDMRAGTTIKPVPRW